MAIEGRRGLPGGTSGHVPNGEVADEFKRRGAGLGEGEAQAANFGGDKHRRMHKQWHNFGRVVNPTPHPELVLTQLFHDATDFFVTTASQQATQTTDAAASPPLSADWQTACARLRAGPLVYVPYMPQADALRERLGAAQLLPAQQLPCSDLELAKSLALAGVGVTILPRRVAAADQQKRLVRLHPALPFIHEVVYLAYRADVHRTRAALHLKDALVEHRRRLGRDIERQRLQQESSEIRVPRESL